MVSFTWADVVSVLTSIKTHLIAAGAVLIVGIIIMIAVMALKNKPKRFLIRSEAGIAMLLSIVLIANLICTGPMSTLLDLVSGNGVISEETAASANDVISEICGEGVVLLKNEDNVLPLSSKKVNLFGWSCTVPIYGGTGSGALNTKYHVVDMLEGLDNAGIAYNTELTAFYQNYATARGVGGMISQDWTMPEPNVSLYTDEMLSNAKAFSDTAIVVIARSGGEGFDLPTDMTSVVNGTYMAENANGGTSTYCAASYDDTLNAGNDWDEGDHYLQLDNREEELIDLVCANFDNVIVIYNGSNAMEMGFVNEHKQIKGALWVAGAGQSGFNALGGILSGDVNPSGRMVDTYVYDLTATPSWNNWGSKYYYTNMDEFKLSASDNFWLPDCVPSFMNYSEGIYVGYRYYETAAAEGAIDYDAVVQYPFGYGLSYTTFSQTMKASEANGVITVEVTVTNTGSVAGKDVVEVYYNPPYYNGGIEKASANLIDYAKTDVLEPGASQTVTITFNTEDMASFDNKVNNCYVLEAGDYVISVNADAHRVIDSWTWTLDKTVVYDESNPRSTDQVAATSQLAYAEDNGFTYLSRADAFANYGVATAAPTNFEMSADSKAGFYNIHNYLTAEVTASEEDPDATYPTTGASNGLTMQNMRGLAYDDPQWEKFLDQLTLDDMKTLIALGGYQTAAVASVGKIRSNDCDGPSAINNNFTGQGSVGFPACVMVAATWNKDLAKAYGESIGKMADEMDTSGWYAPAMNIHRSAFGGRNFEYYSEDPIISGYTAANELIGAWEYGVYGYIKHFVLNDSEANRCSMMCIWSSEQATREIYMKPFEIAVKKGNAMAVMSSFDYVGNRWAGGSKAILQNILRDEWGFNGMVLTDYYGVYGYMNADQEIRNGGDFCLTNMTTATNYVQFDQTAGAQQAMRTAAHHILYVTSNSRSYADANLNSGLPLWKTVMIAADVVVVLLAVLWEVLAIRGYRKRRKAAQG